jgi:enoyl-CoA hydratase/carnithine racemase
MVDIEISRDGAVLVVTINRPQKRNALTFAMYGALEEALRTTDPDVRAILVTGAGENFTAGNDLQDFLRVATSGNVKFDELPQARFLDALVETTRPLVAAVHGAAIGIGATMLLHCDLVYASETARLEMPFVSLGLVPEAASSLLLPERVGHVVAAELLLLGASVDARRAKELGLVNEIVPSGELVALARAKAHALAAKPPEALRAARELIRGHGRVAVLQRMRVEGAYFGERLASAEAHAAFDAFLSRGRATVGEARV